MHNILYILKQLPRQGQPFKPTLENKFQYKIGAGANRPKKPTENDPSIADGDFNTGRLNISGNPNTGLGAGVKRSADLPLWKIKLLDKNSNTLNPNKQLISQIGTQLAKGSIGLLGNPLANSIGDEVINSIQNTKSSEIYSLSSYEKIRKYSESPARFAKYRDFRKLQGLNKARADGASATINLGIDAAIQQVINPRTAAYAAANLLPGGVYSIINLETLYGWGDHGNTSALRKDFTARTQVSTRWKKGTPGEKGNWVQDPVGIAFPFRGDKINVVDYSKRTLKNVYKWKPDPLINLGLTEFLNEFDQTQDFIKFYFTGPTLSADKLDQDDVDDVIVFRATLDSLTDTHTPRWSDQQMIGRADPDYIYSGYNRSIDMGFDINVTSRDELKPIWRKLNALASYTTPEYVDNATLKGPWMRITIGDLFVQTPFIITRLTYTMIDANTTWEINIEDDPSMMQVPKRISVNVGGNLITDTLPQKNGRMYSLAKRYEKSELGIRSLEGSDNWLSDFKDVAESQSGGSETTSEGADLNSNPTVSTLLNTSTNPENQPQ